MRFIAALPRARLIRLGVAGALATTLLPLGAVAGANRAPVSTRPVPTTVSGLKAPMRGVVDRNALPLPAWSSTGSANGPIGGYVLRVAWKDLQNSDGSITAGNPIDAALAHLPAGFQLKVRLLAGANAPGWLLKTAGSVTLSNDGSGSAAVLKWWVPAANTAYNSLISGLAARYDTNPAISDVTISRCMVFTAEPLLRPGNASNLAALSRAGLTAALDEQCQSQAIAAHGALVHTRSSLALNPYQKITSGGSAVVDEAYTRGLMDECRSTLGYRCVLENNSLKQGSRGGDYDNMYAAIKAHGAPIAIQTANSSNFRSCSSLLSVLNIAVSLGSNSVELPFNYNKLCSPADVALKDAALQQNPSP